MVTPRVGKRFRLMTGLGPLLGFLPLSLSRLLKMSGSDKQAEGRHSYGAAYGRILRTLKWRRCTLLEIGIGGYDSWAGGESLAAWRAYLPFGRVVGCDIVDKRVLTRRRIDIRIVDQGNDDQLKELAASVGPFDVVIDDGSHLNHHQISTFRAP